MTMIEVVLTILIVVVFYMPYLLIIRRVVKLEAKVTRASNLSIEAIARAKVNEVFVEVINAQRMKK